MDFFDFLSLMGGLSIFLFGMNIMGQSLERRAGSRLEGILARLTGNRYMGLLTGLAVTAVIQSSSATTVMVVGFVNSGLMTLAQAVNVIMGANIGTTVTAWILSLAGIDGGNFFVRLLKPSSFTPVLALIGIALYMFSKRDSKKDTGLIMLGFATLMYGMDSMSGAVAGLRDVPEFAQMFVAFSNPVLGVLAGALLTAIIQSSSASVGILQALASTGAVSYGSAVPIIMGQNIGTCVTALLSSVGTNKNAKRAAYVHLFFNIIGTAVLLCLYVAVRAIFAPAILGESASLLGIAIIHSLFNVLCVMMLFPAGGALERLVCLIVRDGKEQTSDLDERLLQTPALALSVSRSMTEKMARSAAGAMKKAMGCFTRYSKADADSVRAAENECDGYEDMLGTYLIKLSSSGLGQAESGQAAAMLKLIGDFERISDHAVNILESAEELRDKHLTLTETAMREYDVIAGAVNESIDLAVQALTENDVHAASKVESLEQIIDDLKEKLRTRHILRMQRGLCSTEVGFVWSDMLTNLERVSDHCSNIAGCVLDTAEHNLNMHDTLRQLRIGDSGYASEYKRYLSKYSLDGINGQT